MATSLSALSSNVVATAAVTARWPAERGSPESATLASAAFHRSYPAARMLPSGIRNSFLTLIEETRPTAIIIHYAHLANALRYDCLAAVPDDVPILVRCHGVDVTWSRFRYFPLPFRVHGNTPRYRRQLIRLTNLSRFVANSSEMAAHLTESGFPVARVSVVPLGTTIDPRWSPPRSGDSHIVYVGRLVDCKGPLETIAAFNTLRRRGVEASLTVAGDGPLRRKVERSVAKSPFRSDIRVLGAVSHQRALQLIRDAAIVTAHNREGRNGQVESFGVVAVEAMAAGRPFVTGRSGGPIETVGTEEGLLFDPGDVEGHATILQSLLEDRPKLHSIGERGRARVERSYSLEAEAVQTLSLISDERRRRRVVVDASAPTSP